MKRKILIFLLAGILLGLVGSQWFSEIKNSDKKEIQSEQNVNQPTSEQTEISDNSIENSNQIPSKVYTILKYVTTFHQPKEGYIGGRTFHNYEKQLPVLNTNGVKIKYQEWDVNPKQNRLKRGKERLITGDDNSAWYTNDHYKSFIKIN